MAKEDKSSSEGCATVLGGAVMGIVALIAAIPKEAWIVVGIVVGAAALLGAVAWAIAVINRVYVAAGEQARAEQEAQAVAAEQLRKEKLRKQQRQRIEELGAKNAARVDSAPAAINRVTASEAVRSGWLGDVDFTADIRGITDRFRKARSLLKIADELSALDKPSADDRKILSEAKVTVAGLERAAVESVELIEKCATEARRIDESLRREREDARTGGAAARRAARKAEGHAPWDLSGPTHLVNGLGSRCGDGASLGLPRHQEPNSPSPRRRMSITPRPPIARSKPLCRS